MAIPSPLGDGGAAAGFRRPRLEIAFGDGPGGGSGGGLASAAASALGAGGQTDPWSASVVCVSLERGLAPAVDVARIELAPAPHAPPVDIGDAGSVSLGYADAGLELVFTGEVEAVQRRLAGGVRLLAADGGRRLAGLRVNQSFEQQSAGRVVRELADLAGVPAGTIEDGLDLPFYAVDDRRSALAHVAELARRCGFLARLTPEGELDFRADAAGSPVRTYRYGEEVLWLEHAAWPPPRGGVTVRGEGAAGAEGADAWAWIAKDPEQVSGEADGGGTGRVVSDPALRSADAASTAAQSRSAAADRSRSVARLVVPGSPEVTVGDVVAVEGSPEASLNGNFRVRRLRHVYAKERGFLTELWLGGAGGGGGASGLAGVLP